MNTQSKIRTRSLRESVWPDHPQLCATAEVIIPFHDADPTGFTWHGNYFKYYDEARVKLLQKLNFDYQSMASAGQFWPIVDTRVMYAKSALFGERISVEAQLVEWEFRLRIFYKIINEKGQCINEAYTLQVPVDAESQELIIGSPQALQDRIQHLLMEKS